jgi:hypothetical protein
MPTTTVSERIPEFAPQSRWATFLAYLYLLRVPLTTAAILVLFPIFALRSSFGQPVFQNFFFMDWWASAVTSLATLMVAWSVVLSGLVLLFNASDRLRVSAVLNQDRLKTHSRATRGGIVLVTVVVSAPMLSGQFLQRDWVLPHFWQNVAGVAGGALAAYLLALLALWIALSLMPSSVIVAAEIFPAPEIVRKWLDHRHQRPCPLPGSLLRWFADRVVKLPKDLRVGFVDDRPLIAGRDNPAYGLPWSGVLLSAAFALVTFVVYSAIGFVNAYDAADESWSGTTIPALALVLLLLLNANWFLGLTAYFWDRFRIPLLALLVVAAFLGEYLTDYAEHYYRLTRRPVAVSASQSSDRIASSTLVSPAAVLRNRVRDGKPVIVVATMGGGIQAAAWTVRVLTGLETQVRAELGPDRLQGRSFADSVALVSSVSGGATGSLFFLNQYTKNGARPGFRPGPVQCERVTDEGTCLDFTPLLNEVFKSRLDDVAWALVYRDIPRIVFPYFPGSYGLLLPIGVPEGRFLDRGRMLELSWQRAGIRGRLSDWYEGLEEGWRPASVFNATVAETGEPFLFSTTTLKTIGADEQLPGLNPTLRRADPSWRNPKLTTFAELYQDADIDLVTAARLASGFPYVLPIPRAYRVDQPASVNDEVVLKYHLIDGGYYDNYGVDAVVQWLDQGLRELQASGDKLPDKVLILQIRAFPDIRLPNVQHPPTEEDPFYTEALPRNRGWLFELFSPIAGLLHVRSSGQLLQNRDELLLLRAKWRSNGDQRVDIRFATFEFPGASAPLSFKMNPTQRDNILKHWNEYVNDEARRPLDIEQVKCMFDDTLPRCNEARVSFPE